MNSPVAATVASIMEAAQRQATPLEAVETPLERLRGQLMARRDLANLPKPDPRIADTVDVGTLVLLAGYTGTGKTFIALDWACCIAAGRPWQGRATRAGRVLYVASEGAEGLHARIAAWEYAWGMQVADLDVLPAPVQLAAERERHALAELVAEGGYVLVVVDTLARCAVGLDENSARDMGLVVDAADAIRRTTRATVLLIHHTGKDKTTVRGSSALESGVDTVYATEGDIHHLKLTRTKRKEGPREDVHLLTIKANASGSCHVQTADMATESADRTEQLLSVFLSVFRQTGATKAQLREEAGMASSTFHRALNNLLTAGSLTNVGTDQRPFYKVGSGR